MRRFHINKNEEIVICRARKGRCPFATEEQHFISKIKAEKIRDYKMKERYSILPNIPL